MINHIATIGIAKVEFHDHLTMLDGKTPYPYKFIVEKLGYCLGDAVYTFHASYTTQEAAIAGATKLDTNESPARRTDLLRLYAKQESEPETPVRPSKIYCSSCGCETSFSEMRKNGDVATEYCGC
jgi:hypothetical protein